MIVEWTNTFKVDFDLDQAEEDFRMLLEYHPERDVNTLLYDAIEANWAFDGEEYIDTAPAIEQCAKALRARVGGVQMRMELN